MNSVINRSDIYHGVWPVMLTPFTAQNQIDYPALDALTDYYLAHGAQGLFAVCQSSEMFFLSLEERLGIARAVVRRAAGRAPVIASGHISDSPEEQANELCAMADTGIDALILITNRLDPKNEGEAAFRANLDWLLARLLSDGCLTRRSAVDLLATDALITYAFEASSDEPATIEARAARAMARLSAMVG